MLVDMKRYMAAKHLATHPVANHRDGWFFFWVFLIGAAIVSSMIMGLTMILSDSTLPKEYNGPAEKTEVVYHETDAGTTVGIHMTEGYYEFLEQTCRERPEAGLCN